MNKLKKAILFTFLFLTPALSQAQTLIDSIYIEHRDNPYYLRLYNSDESSLFINRDICQNVLGYDIHIDTVTGEYDEVEELELLIANMCLHRFNDVLNIMPKDVFTFNTNFVYYILNKGDKPKEILDSKNNLYYVIELYKLEDLTKIKSLIRNYEKTINN